MASRFRRASAEVAGDSELPEGLRHADLNSQRTFWRRVATELGHTDDPGCRWYTSTVALCSDSHYDALGRYFDATPPGIAYIYRKKAKPEGMDPQGFFDALVDHYGFNSESGCDLTSFNSGSSGSDLTRDTVSGALKDIYYKAAGRDGFISLDAFSEVMRKLRIGMLLASTDPHGKADFAPEIGTAMYYSEYHDGEWKMKIMEYDTAEDQGHKDQMEALMAKAQLDKEHLTTEYQPVSEFLFDSPHSPGKKSVGGSGKVQWLHVHQPNTSLVLALGQQFHLRLSVMGILCRIEEVPPQIDASHASDRHGWGSASWSSVVFPCVFLDHQSKSLFRNHKAWRKRREQDSRENSGNTNVRMRAKASALEAQAVRKKGTDDDDKEPPIFVGVIRVTQVLLWSGSTTEGEARASQPGHQTVITSLGTPSYIGYWLANAGSSSDGGLWAKLLRLLPCSRRSKSLSPAPKEGGDGYAELPQDEQDADDMEAQRPWTAGRSGSKSRSPTESFAQTMRAVSMEEADELMQNSGSNTGLLQYREEAELNTKFERFYDDILGQLKKKNSVLRMGTHFHLLIRIILDGTSEYLDVLELYQEVISKCKAKLSEPHSYKDGPDLMSMISLSKMELTSILRSLQGFQADVLPKLEPLCEARASAPTLSERIINHHMIDINHNVVQVVRECQSQIHICESLIDDWDRKTADKANNILNILTFITFLMVPMQLATGYYGMNFAHGLPELQTRRGPQIFWGLVTTCTFLMAVLMIALNRAY